MKNSAINCGTAHLFLVLSLSLVLSSCNKEDNPIKYPYGTFPDTVATALENLNSSYDDYNLDIHQLYDNVILLFSSNRNSAGGQFDLIQGAVSFLWDQTTGVFGFGSGITDDEFLASLSSQANTPGDDFGPYRFFSTEDGYEYLLLSSQNTEGDLDFFYLKNLPRVGSQIPAPQGPFPLTLLNTASDDVYISFDTNQDTAYFSSNNGGNFDIYLTQRPFGTPPSTWFESPYSASVPIDSLNTTGDEKCPFVFKNVMVFTSDRPGGMGGFDLYYSIFSDGKWSTAMNFGPDVNTSYNEYRPVIGTIPDYTNMLMMFSSDRPGGKGGYDLYFIGVTIDSE